MVVCVVCFGHIKLRIALPSAKSRLVPTGYEIKMGSRNDLGSLETRVVSCPFRELNYGSLADHLVTIHRRDIWAAVLASLFFLLVVRTGRRAKNSSCEIAQAAGSRPSASAARSRSRSRRHFFRGETLTDLHLPTERSQYE